MASSEEFKYGEFQGKVIQELESLNNAFMKMTEAIEKFKESQGIRTGQNEKAIERLEGKIDVVLMVAKWIFAPVFSSMGISLMVVAAMWAMNKLGHG